MGEIFFTGDYHLNHTNILKHEPDRPWCNVKEMAEGLIERFNSRVKKNDVCYFAGDMWFGDPSNWRKLENILSKMNGTKHLVLGNHDDWDAFLYVKCGFTTVHTAVWVEEFIVVHDPSAAIIDKSKHWLTAHVHTLFKRVKNALNVGVDVWDFFPVSLDEVRNEFL